MESLKTIIDAMLKKYGIAEAVTQNKALVIWDEIVGEKVAKNTEAERVEHGVLIVKVSSPTWRQELHFRKNEILNKLNNSLGKNTIKDIRFI